jgi:hypothetical protein
LTLEPLAPGAGAPEFTASQTLYVYDWSGYHLILPAGPADIARGLAGCDACGGVLRLTAGAQDVVAVSAVNVFRAPAADDADLPDAIRQALREGRA